MKTKMYQRLGFGFCLLWFGIAPAAAAEIPAGRDTLVIHTGTPQKPGESIVSISGRWVADDGIQTGFTGLTFVNGPDMPKPDTGYTLARKIAKSARRQMAYLRISLRGIGVKFVNDKQDPRYVIANNEGIPISKITIRDFTSEKFTAEIGAKSFNSHGVETALDFVESDAVAKVVINYAASDQKSFRAAGGGIEVSIGEGKTVSVETANRTTQQIEKDLARKISGSFSSTPLYPDEREKRDTKNIKPFDGGEVNLGRISEKAITVNVKDPSLGVVTRFKFKEPEAKKSGWW